VAALKRSVQGVGTQHPDITNCFPSHEERSEFDIVPGQWRQGKSPKYVSVLTVLLLGKLQGSGKKARPVP